MALVRIFTYRYIYHTKINHSWIVKDTVRLMDAMGMSHLDNPFKTELSLCLAQSPARPVLMGRTADLSRALLHVRPGLPVGENGYFLGSCVAGKKNSTLSI